MADSVAGASAASTSVTGTDEVSVETSAGVENHPLVADEVAATGAAAAGAAAGVLNELE